MGNWQISIEGTGAHHNHDYPSDANQLAKEFVEQLKAKGHTVERASFTYGGRDVFPSNYTNQSITSLEPSTLQDGTVVGYNARLSGGELVFLPIDKLPQP